MRIQHQSWTNPTTWLDDQFDFPTLKQSLDRIRTRGKKSNFPFGLPNYRPGKKEEQFIYGLALQLVPFLSEYLSKSHFFVSVWSGNKRDHGFVRVLTRCFFKDLRNG